jgi:hypothetical protein
MVNFTKCRYLATALNFRYCYTYGEGARYINKVYGKYTHPSLDGIEKSVRREVSGRLNTISLTSFTTMGMRQSMVL